MEFSFHYFEIVFHDMYEIDYFLECQEINLAMLLFSIFISVMLANIEFEYILCDISSSGGWFVTGGIKRNKP